MRSFCLTFDVDLTDYLSNKETDELDDTFEPVKAILEKYPQVKTTWFIRIDKQIEQLYGSPDHIFTQHRDKLSWLLMNGHALGWHYHAYRQVDGKWVQNTNDDEICAELEIYAPVAKQHNLQITRMGWGFHTGKTLKALRALGFKTDSSAIPRPKYKWDLNIRDWETSPDTAFFPGTIDYRTEAGEKIGILEVPINTAVIPLNTDTEEVKRYINAAYRHNAFKDAVNALSHLEQIVSITHPYELVPNVSSHALLSFSTTDFEQNVKYLLQHNYELINMLTLINRR